MVGNIEQGSLSPKTENANSAQACIAPSSREFYLSTRPARSKVRAAQISRHVVSACAPTGSAIPLGFSSFASENRTCITFHTRTSLVK
jgi:hypothetical protein